MEYRKNEETRKRSESLSFPVASFFPAWILHFLVVKEGDSDCAPAWTVLHDPRSRLRDVPVRRVDYARIRIFSTSHAHGAQSRSASMHPPERTIPRQLRTHKSEAIPGREWNTDRQLVVARLLSERQARLVTRLQMLFLVGTPNFPYLGCGGSIGRGSTELRLILSFSHYATTSIRSRLSSSTFARTLSTRRSIYIQWYSMAVFPQHSHVHG